MKIIVAKLDDRQIIGELQTENNIVTNCYQLITIVLNGAFHYQIKPLILPFSLANPVNFNMTRISEWVIIEPIIFENLINEYIRIKTEIAESITKQNIPPIHLH